MIPASNFRHSRETGRVKTLTSGNERPLRHSRESGNPGVLEGSLRSVSPLHPAWIPAFAGMTISGAGASLGWGFDTPWKEGIPVGWGVGQRLWRPLPPLDSRFRGNDGEVAGMTEREWWRGTAAQPP